MLVRGALARSPVDQRPDIQSRRRADAHISDPVERLAIYCVFKKKAGSPDPIGPETRCFFAFRQKRETDSAADRPACSGTGR